MFKLFFSLTQSIGALYGSGVGLVKVATKEKEREKKKNEKRKNQRKKKKRKREKEKENYRKVSHLRWDELKVTTCTNYKFKLLNLKSSL